MNISAKAPLPEDVKQRFPSMRYWQKRFEAMLEQLSDPSIDELKEQIRLLESTIQEARTTLLDLRSTLDALEVPRDVSRAKYWLAAPYTLLPNSVDLSTLGNGYVQTTYGEPSVVAQIPDTSIQYAQINLSGTEIDWTLGRLFYVELAGDTTFTFANEVVGKQILVIVKQDAAVARACHWPVGVKWSGGSEPDLTAVTTGSTNVFSFVHYAVGESEETAGTSAIDMT